MLSNDQVEILEQLDDYLLWIMGADNITEEDVKNLRELVECLQDTSASKRKEK